MRNEGDRGVVMKVRPLGQVLADLGMWIVAVPIAVYLRLDFTLPSEYWTEAIGGGLFAGLIFVGVGYALKLYRGRYKFGSFDEVSGVVQATVIVLAAWYLLRIFTGLAELPRSVPALAAGLALSGMLGLRFGLRFWRERVAKRTHTGENTLIYGAGDSGQQLIRAMSPTRSGYRVVALLDDDPHKRRLRLQGVPVQGTGDDLEKVVKGNAIKIVVVSFAGVKAEQLRDLDSRCRALGVQLRVIPSPVEIVRGTVRLSDVTEVTEEDLLGRKAITTSETDIGRMLNGRRVLITGAGGSIGSELSRQVHSYGPAFLALLDRDESALHSLHLSMFGVAMLDSDDLFLADIRDEERIHQIMASVQPDVVFHAAALKHLPMLEAAPDEAFKTNVLGTRNVLDAADKAGTPIFVNISTDKAAEPISVLGYSKRTAERLTAGIRPAGGRYLSVRFGNVLGSRGSMLETFRAQIASGGPVTVTHPEVTRYFMTVQEAVHLVLQAATFGDDGETLILDMGEPVKIQDVAQHMVEKSGREIDIVYTGLRTGEKLHEVLSSEQEEGTRPHHPLVTHVRVMPMAGEDLESEWGESARASREAMQRMALVREVPGDAESA